jgi:hypothetical protein
MPRKLKRLKKPCHPNFPFQGHKLEEGAEKCNCGKYTPAQLIQRSQQSVFANQEASSALRSPQRIN